MRFTLILGAVAVTASPILKEKDSIQTGTAPRKDYANLPFETIPTSREKAAELEGKLRALNPRAPAPTIAPILAWDLGAEDVFDQATEDDIDDLIAQKKKPKKEKKPKKSKKPKTKTKFRTKTKIETKTETATLIPIPPVPTKLPVPNRLVPTTIPTLPTLTLIPDPTPPTRIEDDDSWRLKNVADEED
ncbi:hypothetical protein N0V93_001770 [Gnomoniopsis smithogilvyi]|uniref:Uncharacterized protein n=1 Tax=Gnomoniopsis smithogilvyi TaxID=1191159 RepID=A0A9W8Z2N5_9PEZI|nr:hypothetical protein N0V93_001770 [Gnomoniopsis smithogilvyi]